MGDKEAWTAARRAACLAGCVAALSCVGAFPAPLTPAAAADLARLPVKAIPETAPVASWTQFYVGAGIGFDFGTGRSVLTPIGGGADLVIDGLQGADLGLSAFAGFDVQVAPRFVLGAFIDYDWARQKTTLAGNADVASATIGFPALDRGWTVGGRAGFLVTPDVLLYGLAGYSEMRIENWSFAFAPAGGPAVALHESTQNLRGYTVGAGAEYRLANNVSLRGEYRYLALGSATTVDVINGTILTNSVSEHVVRIGAAYRFGQFGIVAPAPATRSTAPSWTGFYVGAGFGGDAIAPHVAGTIAGALDVHAEGFGGADVGGTVMAGYDRQLAPNWVIGAFALIDGASNGGARFSAGAPGFGAISSDLGAVQWGWTVGGRAGYLVVPNTLVYVLGGYTGVTLHSVSYDLMGVAGTGPTPQYRGATFGGGFERLFTDTITARAEYRGTHLGTLNNLVAPGWTNLSAGGTVHTVRAVLSYRIPAGS